MSEKSNACASGGSERQTNGFMLPDSLDTQREQQFDRLGTSVIGNITCKPDVSMTSGVCRMKTPAYTLEMNATHDRQTAKCAHSK